MGQYYKAVNIDKKEMLVPWTWNNGAKLMEHSWLPNDFVGVAMKKLTSDWKGDRIVWAGDYGDEGLFMEDLSNASKEETLYSYASNNFTEIKNYKTFNVEKFNVQFPFIINYDKKEFIDTRKCPSMDGWIVHPLPLLTSNGNGRGGGDYRVYDDDNDISLKFVGTWAGDRIAVVEELPQQYEEIEPNFKE